MNSEYQPMPTINDINAEGSKNYNEYIGHIFLPVSSILFITFSISIMVRDRLKNGITIVTIISWIIFGILFSVMFYRNNNTTFNVSTSIFVIFISCLVTCREINAIKTCMI